MRILYSFPHKIGAARICYTAWEQVRGLAAAGAQVTVMPGAVSRPLPASVTVRPTLAWGKLRIPYRLLGRMGACVLHDKIVSRRLEKMASEIDIVHCWPLGSLETMKTAKRIGIPAVLERPNAHTRFCYETVAAECRRIGVSMPHHDYKPDGKVLAREEEEFDLAFRLLCPSKFTAQSFLDRGFSSEKLLRHTYGFDEVAFVPGPAPSEGPKKFTALFVGVDAVRKGLHLALEAWLSSPASRDGLLLVAGELSPEYKKRFAEPLSQPGVLLLGHRNDVPELMRQSDILLMPSLEEGFGLVCVEAIGSGCVPLVSMACTEECRHMHNSLVHPIGDTETLKRHITMLYEDRSLLQKLREACIRERLNYTWTAASQELLGAYQVAIERYAAVRKRPAAGQVSRIAAQPGVPTANWAPGLMGLLDTKYVVVTPVRDEETYLPLTIESMVRQTVHPQEWVIVDDGSKDNTGRIVDEAARQYPWIRGLRREDRGFRKWGAGIIEAFYDGFHALACTDWEFMAKLDGDLSFEPDYFAQMFGKFTENPRLGIGGGFLYHLENGQKTLERTPMFHVRGGAKIYRRACWEAIGGLWVGPGSDTVDEVKANQFGWSTRSFLELQIQHHRWTGAAYGRWGGIAKNGKTDYVSGYHPLFFVAKSVARLWQRPYILGSFALLYGYVSAYLQNTPRVDDPQLIKYLQRQQLAKLCGQETIWK